MEGNAAETTRIMPNSFEAEQSVVGSMIMDTKAINEVEGVITGADFYHKVYGLLFDTIIELNNTGVRVDPVILQTKLKEKGAPPESYSNEFIRDLVNAVPTTVNAKRYAEIVCDKAVLRNIIRVNETIVNQCYEGNGSAETILTSAQESIFNLARNKTGRDFTPVNEILQMAIDKINKAYINKGKLSGIATGFTDLDECLSGLQPSDFILIGARPSMGKTAFVLNIAENVAVKQKIGTAIFSLEMSNIQMINRMLSLETNIEAQKFRKGDLTAANWDNLIDGADTLAASSLIIDETPSISITELRSRCRKYKAEYDIGLIIIDYLQLMTGGGKSNSRQEEVAEISRSLKAIARELNVPVIALSQLSRSLESRQDKRPMLSDLRESGSIEQDADVVMFIYRDDYYDKDSEQKNIAEIIVAKQRNGPVQTVKLGWIPQQTKFVNLARPQDM